MRTVPSLVGLVGLVAMSALAFASAGCARQAPEPTVPTSASIAVMTAPATADEAPASAASVSESAAFTQKPGDYIVYRFSGGFRKAPLLLTQRVVEATDVLLVVDLTLDDGTRKTTARARYTHAPGAAHELVSASRLDASGAERPMSLAELDALMAQTTLAADDNEGAIASESVTLSVGGRDIPCTRTSYRVVVGKRAATMRTLSSESFPWGDVGGEITSDQGRVLYRAEVVDVGGELPIVAASR
jgi:hypothetical protein